MHYSPSNYIRSGQYKAFMRSISIGKLVLEDAFKASDRLELRESLEVINPTAIYTAPLDPEKYGWDGRLFLDSSSDISQTGVLARVTRCIGENVEIDHYLISKNLSRTSNALKELILSCSRKLKPKPKMVEEEHVVEELIDQGFRYAKYCLDILSREYEVVIIESYSNAATPILPPIEDLRYVILTSQNRMMVYDGSRYQTVLKLVGGVKTPLSTTTTDILRLLDPLRIYDLKPETEPFNTEAMYFRDMVGEILELEKREL